MEAQAFLWADGPWFLGNSEVPTPFSLTTVGGTGGSGGQALDPGAAWKGTLFVGILPGLAEGLPSPAFAERQPPPPAPGRISSRLATPRRKGYRLWTFSTKSPTKSMMFLSNMFIVS